MPEPGFHPTVELSDALHEVAVSGRRVGPAVMVLVDCVVGDEAVLGELSDFALGVSVWSRGGNVDDVNLDGLVFLGDFGGERSVWSRDRCSSESRYRA